MQRVLKDALLDSRLRGNDSMGCVEGQSPFARSLRVSLRSLFNIPQDWGITGVEREHGDSAVGRMSDRCWWAHLTLHLTGELVRGGVLEGK
jgi:hypothetical protein